MDGLEIASREYFLWNDTEGRVMADLAGDTPVPVASLTKIMTTLVVLARRELDETVEITSEMLAGLEEFAVLGLTVGQVATVEDLLYATMLPSAGDAAQALAISTSGSIEAFAAEMNRLATEIGMTHTHFSNPVGFDAENYSTAHDIALLLDKALEDQRFVTIFDSFEQELPSLGKAAKKTFATTKHITGGKTGYTEAAGRCLASTAEIEGVQYTLVTLGAPAEGTQHVADTEKIYQAVEDRYGPARLIAAGDQLVQIPVEGSATKELAWRAEADVVKTLPKDVALDELQYEYIGETQLTRKTPSETVVGYFQVRNGDNILYTQEISLSANCDHQENCVTLPEFYPVDGWVGLGTLATLLLFVGTILSFRRARKMRKSPRRRRWLILAWLRVLAMVLGLGLMGVLWKVYYPTHAELVVNQLEPIWLDEETAPAADEEADAAESSATPTSEPSATAATSSASPAGGNCTTGYGNLMLINPNFTVDENFITARASDLISISQTYGIQEYHRAGNGDNLMQPEAAVHLNEMLAAYRAEFAGHEMGTYSCFRKRGTTCGRLCAATGASDHHTGLTCDLIDLAYGDVLDADDYDNHKEWQWLRANSYKYGFIDRFPEAWAGGPMSAPLNVDANGSTGLFETWHYRYVGVTAATEIATGKYNNGQYDSLEHYLKATARVKDLKVGLCE